MDEAVSVRGKDGGVRAGWVRGRNERDIGVAAVCDCST